MVTESALEAEDHTGKKETQQVSTAATPSVERIAL